MTTYFVTNETKYYTRYESKNIDHNFGDELPRSYVPILHPISRPAAPKPEKIKESTAKSVVPVLPPIAVNMTAATTIQRKNPILAFPTQKDDEEKDFSYYVSLFECVLDVACPGIDKLVKDDIHLNFETQNFDDCWQDGVCTAKAEIKRLISDVDKGACYDKIWWCLLNILDDFEKDTWDDKDAKNIEHELVQILDTINKLDCTSLAVWNRVCKKYCGKPSPKPEKITESVEDVVPVLSSPVLSSPVPSSNHSIPEMPSTHVASPSMIEKIVSWFQEFTNLSAWQKWFQDLVPVFFSSKKLRSFLNVFVQVLAAESLLRHLDNWGFMPAFVKNFFRWILNLDFVKNGLANLNTLVDFICDKADEFREFVVRKIMEMVALLAAVKA